MDDTKNPSQPLALSGRMKRVAEEQNVGGHFEGESERERDVGNNTLVVVDIFNEQDSNEIQVMCNYNVLATGFDSPQIDTVIIARPTTSIVSYQQMIGRGLRGEEFGGKLGNRCDIVTVKDNITKFNDERVDLGYIKYEKELKELGK